MKRATLRAAGQPVRRLATLLCGIAACTPTSIADASTQIGNHAGMPAAELKLAYQLAVAALNAGLASGARPLRVAYAEAEARLYTGWRP